MEDRIILSSSPGARRKRKRVGRGAGSTHGSKCGRGDKGQNSRSGGGVRTGFEGGQMPLKRRLPKRGFHSLTTNLTAQVRLDELAKFAGKIVDLETLKKNGIISKNALKAKVIASGELKKSVKVKGLLLSAGARSAIESAKGKIIEE